MTTQIKIEKTGYNLPSFVHITGICLCLITACSVFKEKSFYQTDSLQLLKTSRHLKQESAKQSEVIALSGSASSTDAQTSALIFPRGKFSYSLREGFTGEADKLVINEQRKKNILRKSARRQVERSQAHAEVKDAAQSRKHSLLKEKVLKPKNLAWLYLAGLGVLFVLIWRLRRFLY